MEKQRKITKYNFFSGLLRASFFAGLLFCGKVHAQQRLTYNIIKELSVKPVNQTNFSGADCAFELKIPYIKSDLVQAQIPDLPSGVNFVSLRRSEYSDEATKESGTKIELWLNFADAKTYRMRALHVYINSRLYYLPFEPVVIFENPRNIMPRLVVTFEDGTELISQRHGKTLATAPFTAVSGKPLKFTVSLQYGVQIISYAWTVPKNALLQELEQFEITKGTIRSSEFTDEKNPVAVFEWEPLYAGKLTLPEVHILATSYTGTRVDLTLPDTLINVVEGNVSKKNDYSDGESFFGYAFAKRAEKPKISAKSEVSSEECERIAALRSEERRAIPFTSKYHLRKQAEQKNGISDGTFEPTYFMLFLALFFLILFVVMLVSAVVTGRLSMIITCSGLFILALVSVIIAFVQINRTYAVFKGGSISPVPEKNASASASIESGKRVLVEQKAGNWVFVRYGSSGGWVTDDNIVFIQ